MKFKKFLEKTSIYGTILKASGEKNYWLLCGDVIAKIPENMVVLGNETITMPKALQDTIDDCNNRLDNIIDDELEFYDSELPVKHGVASDIVRLFRNMNNFDNVIRISNLEFSFIEKTDGLRYYVTEDDKFLYHIMVITGNRVGEVEALIVKKVEKKEKDEQDEYINFDELEV